MNRLVRIQFITVTGSAVLLIIKAIAYFITHSNAILSDALESIVNLTAGGFALYSLMLSLKPSDRSHPYGHGKIEFLSATFEGSMIMIAGVLIIGKAVYNFFFPYMVYEIHMGIYLTAAAGAVNFVMGRLLVFQGRKYKSMAIEADGKHLMSDAYSTVGMVIGLGIVYFTELTWIDNLIAMTFGAIIAVTGLGILKKSIAGIMDEADIQLLEKIVEVIGDRRKYAWIDLHNLRVIKYGSILHLDCHLTLPWYFDVKKAHDEMEAVENLVREFFGEQAEMFIHADPCSERSCSLCQMPDCHVREHPFERKVNWDIKNTLENRQHRI